MSSTNSASSTSATPNENEGQSEDEEEEVIGRADSHEDVDSERNGYTAMHLAAMFGHKEVVNTLYEARFSAEGMNDKGLNPLHLAVKYGHRDVVKLLLPSSDGELGEHGNTIAHYAAKKGHNDIMELMDDQLIEIQNKHGLNVVHFAAKNGHEKLVDLFLEDDFFRLLEEVDSFGKTPLHYAAESGHEQIVSKLIHRNPRLISETTKDGWTALHLAAECGHDSIVALLLTYAPELRDAKDLAGRTALQLATKSGVGELVAPLLTQNLKSIPVLDSSGKSILHIAGGFKSVVEQVLAQRPWLIDVADSDGKTALYYAVESENPAVVAELLAWNPAVVDARILGACLKSIHCWAILDLLLTARPELAFCVDEKENTLLHRLADRTRTDCNETVLRRVLEMNPLAIERFNKEYATPPSIAHKKEQKDMMAVMQWKMTLDDLEHAYVSIEVARSSAKPLIELQCRVLSLYLNEDVKNLITDYVLCELPDWMIWPPRAKPKKRKPTKDLLDED